VDAWDTVCCKRCRREEEIRLEPNVKIALLTLLALAVAAVALTLVVVVLVDRSTGNTRAANRNGQGGEERES
jgi:hypothetical protein